MSDIEVGNEPPDYDEGRGRWRRLAASALGHRGEWVSIDWVGRSSLNGTIAHAIVKEMGVEIVYDSQRYWVKIP